MRFDISRQPLVPAFLTLFLLAAVAVWSLGTPALGMPEGLRTTPAALLHGSGISCVADGVPSVAAAGASAGAMLPMPGELLSRFQTAYPGWARFLAGFLLLFGGMCTGRMTVRYNLYAVSSCLAIPLYAVAAAGLATGGEYLAAFAVAALLALAVKNFGRAFCNGYGFDPLFRGSFYLGSLLLLYPPALPLALLLPLAIMLFRRTLRETVVALFGFLLPFLFFAYVDWGAGGRFWAAFVQTGMQFIHGTPFTTLLQTPLPRLALAGSLLLLDTLAILFLLADLYFVGTKARFILLYNIGVLALAAATLCGPAATSAAYALLAVPSAVLLPVFFVRIRRKLSLPLYLLLLAGALLGMVLQ